MVSTHEPVVLGHGAEDVEVFERVETKSGVHINGFGAGLVLVCAVFCANKCDMCIDLTVCGNT